MKEQEMNTEFENLNTPLEFETELIVDEDFESLIEFSTRRC